jgi:tetratricopeptide (TPR) repeat protein
MVVWCPVRRLGIVRRDTSCMSEQWATIQQRLQQASIQLTPQGHLAQAGRLNTLAYARVPRFEQLEERTDLDDAILLYQASVKLTLQGHSHHHEYLHNLACTLQRRFEQHQEPHLNSDLQDAFNAWSEVVEATPAAALQRFVIATHWAKVALQHNNYESAPQAYTAAISLLLRIASIRLDVQSQNWYLREHSLGLACDGAACAIELGQVEQAIEILEAGCSIFWKQSLQLRTPLAELEKVRPDLAERLQQVGKALEQGSLHEMSPASSNVKGVLPVSAESTLHLQWLGEEWEKLLKQACQVPGFQDFLQPVPFSQLHNASGSGVIIVLNVSQLCCDAIILSSHLIKHIPLLDLNLEDATELGGRMVRATRGFGDTVGEHEFEQTLREVLQGLWDVVVSHIESALQEFPTNCRIWWLPTGLSLSSHYMQQVASRG